MFEFCLIVYLTMEEPKYIGNFESCAVANMYVAEYYHDAPYTVCLHEDYIVLPSNFIKKEVHHGQGVRKKK
jgi:hypothetical protein